MSRILAAVTQSEFRNKEVWLSEARFGFEYIGPYSEDLTDASAVLEVGCGSGILLGMLSETTPGIDFEGIEPFGEGFAHLSDLSALLKASGLTIHNVGFEGFETPNKYNLIYSINVFEHLPDWRKFLTFIERHLADDGVCVILCPNYDFPYESHFRIPILFNKRITERVFRKFIASHEEENDVPGLWKSLNFVKLSQVRKEIANTGLALQIHDNITEDLIDRIATDDEFRRRQRVVGWLGAVLKKIGALRLLKLRFFQNLQPYMMLEIRLGNRA